ncbi:MAG: HAMP domain-containing histidine kinase [Anaerolineae bacterium]|nr:HAMP domain-containing histidine kinase [Anaerolineae bacterium]
MRLILRSLTWKLTLAFLLVGLTGAILVAIIVGVRTRSEFDRFLSTRDQSLVQDSLETYYSTHSNWEGVRDMLRSTPPLDFYSRDMVLADANRVIVVGNRGTPVGEALRPDEVDLSTPLTVNGQTVGYLRFVAPSPRQEPGPARPPPDTVFLDRVTWATGVSAGVAALLALLLGSLLARTLTRPLRELTEATRGMASGNFDQRVSVRSADEIGQLATAFNQMNADLARASQLRKQMTADLAHDLRTPLSILRGYTEGLREGRLQGARSLYVIMHDEVVHLQRLVDDLRVLSLADAGELRLNRRAVDPRALLERTGLAYFDQANQRGVELRLEAPDDLPSIEVDTDRMTQVLNNLVSNALRHTEHGQVTLAASAADHSVYLSVSDTGAGIQPDDLPFIFDRFYRADKARQRSDDTSSGLGLAIAKAIVEAHGGALGVTSTPGQGATFTITLPTASDEAHPTRQARNTGRRPMEADAPQYGSVHN